MGHRLTRRRACVFSLLSFIGAAAYAQETAVLGPLEQFNQREATLVVLGQSFALTPQALVSIGNKKYSSAAASRLLQPGMYVSVVGEATASGRAVAKEILVSPSPYVPGASEIFISGVVTSFDRSVGQAKVGELLIDITPTLGSSASDEIQVGSRIEVHGSQAVVGGVAWAAELKTQPIAEMQSISGTGASVSTQSISGTGKNVSTQSISGTGKSLSTQSISGTGSSVSTQSISGTGKAANIQSISGTGISTQSISGTGRSLSTQSISGTGAN